MRIILKKIQERIGIYVSHLNTFYHCLYNPLASYIFLDAKWHLIQVNTSSK